MESGAARSWPPSWLGRQPGNFLFTCDDELTYSEPRELGHGQKEPKEQSLPALPEAPGASWARWDPGRFRGSVRRFIILSNACEAAF